MSQVFCKVFERETQSTQSMSSLVGKEHLLYVFWGERMISAKDLLRSSVRNTLLNLLTTLAPIVFIISDKFGYSSAVVIALHNHYHIPFVRFSDD